MTYLGRLSTVSASKLLGIMVVAVTVLASTSCSRPVAPFTPTSEPRFAGAIVEGLLLARNSSDYDAYMGHYHETRRAIKTKELFEQDVSFTTSAFGDYVPNSKRFSDASFQYDAATKMGYTVVDYYARFTRSPVDVLVEVAFRKIGLRTYVEDVSFNGRGKYY